MARTLDYPPRAFVSTHLIETGVFVQEGGENVSSFRSFSLLMQATPRCTIVALLAVMLASCAWQPTLDHAHALSEWRISQPTIVQNVNHPVPHWGHRPINSAGRC